MMQALVSADRWLFLFLQTLAGRSFAGDTAWIFAAVFFPVFAGAATLLYALWRGRWRTALGAFAAAVAARGAVEVVRLFVERQRPFEVEGGPILVFRDGGGSFPSGHAAFFFALALVVFWRERGEGESRRLGQFLLAAAAVIVFARIVTGIHYPLDIAGGAAIGAAAAWVAQRVAGR